MFPVSFRTCIPKLPVLSVLLPRAGPAHCPGLRNHSWASQDGQSSPFPNTSTRLTHSGVSADVFCPWPGAGGEKQSCCHTQPLQGWKCSNSIITTQIRRQVKKRTQGVDQNPREMFTTSSVSTTSSSSLPRAPAGPAPPPPTQTSHEPPKTFFHQGLSMISTSVRIHLHTQTHYTTQLGSV